MALAPLPRSVAADQRDVGGGGMYGGIGICTDDEARQDEQRRLLHEKVVPLVSRQPGFVSGYWMHDPETGKSHTAVMFADRESAEDFKSFVEREVRRTALAGLTSDTLSAVE